MIPTGSFLEVELLASIFFIFFAARFFLRVSIRFTALFVLAFFMRFLALSTRRLIAGPRGAGDNTATAYTSFRHHRPLALRALDVRQ